MMTFITITGYFKSLLIFFVLVLLQMLEAGKECKEPLGMEDGTIKDHQITARTWLYFDRRDTRYYRPYFARLNNRHGGGAWCSEEFKKYPGQLLEVDLQEDMKLTELATQGRYHRGEWVERFRIEYRRSNDTTFRRYGEEGDWKIFTGNNDTDSIVVHPFAHPLIARVVRIYPLGNLFTIYCLRLELYGCRWKKHEAGLISYSAPFGAVRKDVDLIDSSHDGVQDQRLGVISDGIGKLTDDDYGPRSVKKSAWVGYKRSPTIIVFYFKERRLFQSLSLHINAKKTDIRIFSEVYIDVANMDMKFRLVKRYLPTVTEFSRLDAFRVRIRLRDAVGEVLRLRLLHPDSWLLLSEVDFDTVEPDSKERNQGINGVQRPTPILKYKTLITSENIVKSGDGKDRRKWDATKEIGDNHPVAKARKLSFPIIITIVLVGAVVIALIVTLFIRVCRKSKLSKQPVKYCHEYVTSSNSVRLKPSINLYKFDGSTAANGSASGTLTRSHGPTRIPSHKRSLEKRDKRSDFHRPMRDFDTLSSSQTSELYRTSSPASEFCRHLNGRPSDCSCNCKDCGATLSSSSRSPTELYRDGMVSLHSQTMVQFQSGGRSPMTDHRNT